MLPSMSDERTQAQAQPESHPSNEVSEVLVSGVDTGPADAERQNLTPTEERARLRQLEERRDPNHVVNPENDPAALADRGD